MKPTHKIAHLVPTSMPVDHPLAGPVQKRAQELAIAQARRGHEVEIYSVGDSGGEYTCQGVKYRIGSCRLPGCLRDLGYLIATARELRRQQPDVIHVHDLIQGAAMLSSVPAPKVLTFDDAHFHQGRTSPRYHLTRCALAMYSCVLPASRHTHDTLARHWNLPAHLRAAVVCNGVNRQQFRPQPEMSLRQQWGFDHTACVALACLSNSESSDLVVDAFELARRRHPDLKLVVATTGNQATD